MVAIPDRARSRCKDCHEPIIWARTVRDKFMPLDPEPKILGNCVLTYDVATDELQVEVLGRQTIPPPPGYTPTRYLPHRATCAIHQSHRRQSRSERR